MNLDDVQSLIGYRFRDEKLVVAAFTHSSYVNENPGTANERLEFLGDCALNFLVGERLYLQQPTASEGVLSAKRAALVSRLPLSRLVDELGLCELLRVGVGVNKSAFSEKTRSDIFEALIGAVYLDGGLDACRAVLDTVFYGNVQPERDNKSELQVWAAKLGLALTYSSDKEGDVFVATVEFGGKEYVGRGKTKHGAEIEAARIALDAVDRDKMQKND